MTKNLCSKQQITSFNSIISATEHKFSSCPFSCRLWLNVVTTGVTFTHIHENEITARSHRPDWFIINITYINLRVLRLSQNVTNA